MKADCVVRPGTGELVAARTGKMGEIGRDEHDWRPSPKSFCINEGIKASTKDQAMISSLEPVQDGRDVVDPGILSGGHTCLVPRVADSAKIAHGMSPRSCQ